MPYSYRIPALVLVLLVFLGAWYYAATLKSAPRQSTESLGPQASGEPTAIVRALRPPPASPETPEDPFAPPVQATSELPPLPVPELPPIQPPAEPTPVPEPVSVPFKLTGIVSGAVRRAVLEGSKTAYIALEGDEVEGWLVVQVTETGVTLRAPTGEEVSLQLGPAESPSQQNR